MAGSGLWKVYESVFTAVRHAHEVRNMAYGHDFDHAFSVAELAYRFCESTEFRDHAWLAGLCHNADRIIAADAGVYRADIEDLDVRRMVGEWLSDVGDVGNVNVSLVVTAVLNHGKPNDPKDDVVARALKDADRVVDARLDVVIRSGQLQPDLPVLDPNLLTNDKRGKYNNRHTIVADIVDCLDWGDIFDERFGVRTSNAQAMMGKRVGALRNFLDALIEQREEEGLVPYPIH